MLILFALFSFGLTLLLLVVVHELGHYWAARWLGVKVMEFGVGFPPRAIGLYLGRTEVLIDADTVFLNGGPASLRRGQMVRALSGEDADGRLVARYVEFCAPPRRVLFCSADAVAPTGDGGLAQSLDDVASDDLMRHGGRVRSSGPDRLALADELFSVNWLPLGGFVRLWGEREPCAPQSLARLGPGRRAVVLLSGSVMNAVLPFLALALMFTVPYDEVVGGRVEIGRVVPDSPAEAAGVRVGDRVLAVDGAPLESPRDLPLAIREAAGSEMVWLLERGGWRWEVVLSPRLRPPPGEGAVGVVFVVLDPTVERRSHPPWEAVILGTVATWEITVAMSREVWSWVVGGGAPRLTGSMGVALVAGDATRDVGVRGWLLVAAVLSISMAALNVLPLPMLDGGRLVFVLIEWVRGGKRVPAEQESFVHLIGFVLMLVLVAVASASDLVRLLRAVGAL